MKNLALISTELLATFTHSEKDQHYVTVITSELHQPDKHGLRLLVPNNIDYQDILHVLDAKTRYGFEHVEIHAPGSPEEDGNVVILFFDGLNTDDGNPF